MNSPRKAIYNELLVLRCQQGEEAAWEELVSLWEKRLFYYIRRLIEDEQETWQILQEVWLRVLQGIGKLREPRSLPKWLYAIARHTAMSHLRQVYTQKTIVATSEAPPNAGTDDDLFRFIDAEQVHYGLGRISLAHREVLTLFFLQDLSVDDIAELLEVPAGTVKSRLYYARRALRSVLEKENTHE